MKLLSMKETKNRIKAMKGSVVSGYVLAVVRKIEECRRHDLFNGMLPFVCSALNVFCQAIRIGSYCLSFQMQWRISVLCRAENLTIFFLSPSHTSVSSSLSLDVLSR